MKSASKLSSSPETAQRPKNNRARLEKLLRQMLHAELSASAAYGKIDRTFVPYRRVIE